MNQFPPRKILVALDFSPISVQAWRHAVALKDKCDISLEVVYVEPYQVTGVGLYPMPGLNNAKRKLLRKRIEGIVGTKTKVHVVEGDPATCIQLTAQSCGAGMIVMGTHGRSGPARVVLGSVAETVIRSAIIPVFIARGPVKEISNILAPINFTSYSADGFDYAVHVAARLKAHLTVLHVSDDPVWGNNAPIRIKRLLKNLTKAQRSRCQSLIIESDDITREIMHASINHELIVLVAHSKSLMEDILLGTTVERILRRSKKSILVVPQHKD